MKHRLLALKDGDFTLVEEAKGQSMHSRIGPKLEASHIYLSHPHLETLFQSTSTEPVIVWDVGMGLAANPLLLLEKLRTTNFKRPIEFWSFENDLDGIKTALEHADSFPFLKDELSAMRELVETGQTEIKTVLSKPIRWRLLTGDFRDLSQQAPAPDLLFYDFYDPKTCPELWHHSTLKLCLPQAKPSLFLTYVSATWVRIELLRAGFVIGQGRRTPVKTETTQAASDLSLLEEPLTRAWLEHKRKSNTSLTLTPVEWDQLFALPQFDI